MQIGIAVQRQYAFSVLGQRLHSSEGYRYYVLVHDRVKLSDLDPNGNLFYAKGHRRQQNDEQK